MKRGFIEIKRNRPYLNYLNYLNEKSQTTILIIIAIILVIGVIIPVLIRSNIKQKEEFPRISEINNKLQTCFNQKSVDAIYLVGLYGGYISPDDKDIFKTQSLYTSYGLKNGKNTLPSLLNIEKEISRFLEITLPNCINYEDFPELKLNYEIRKVNTKIKDSIITETKVFLSATQYNKSFTLDKTYLSEVPIRLKLIHATANDIVNKHLESPGFFDLNFLTAQTLNITIIHYNEDILIYDIADDKSKIDSSVQEAIPYSFTFGIDLR